jgi:hypothetical protein
VPAIAVSADSAATASLASVWKRSAKAAVLEQSNLVLCGGALVVALALASWWPLVVGATGEVLWLLCLPTLTTLTQPRSGVRRATARPATARPLTVAPADANAFDQDRERVQHLEAQAQQLRVHYARWNTGTLANAGDVMTKLALPLRAFRDLCEVRQRLLAAISDLSRTTAEAPDRAEHQAEQRLRLELTTRDVALHAWAIERSFGRLLDAAQHFESRQDFDREVAQLIRESALYAAAAEERVAAALHLAREGSA